MIFFDDFSDRSHIIRAPDKWCRDIIVPHLDAKNDVIPVHITDIGHGQNCSRHVNSLMVGHITAINNLTDNIRPLDRLNCEFNKTIIYQNIFTNLNIVF